MEIIVMKFAISGEEVIANLENDLGSALEVSKPRVFQVQNINGEYQSALMPLFMTAPDAKCTIKIEHILTWTKAPSDIEKAYLSQTSGLYLG